jgi:predicted phage replisome organizer
MAEQKKYYWLKLKRDFFKRHDIRIIEEMPNGKDYILFYLKMLIESIDHEGELRFSETIPYNEQMLSVVTNTNVDVVKAAMKIFIDLNMIEILDDSTIYMAEVTKLIGSETAAAARMRKSRKTKKALPECNNVTKECNNVQKCYTEIELEKEKELEKEIELDAEEEKSGADAPDYNDPDDQLTIFKGNILLSENQMGHLLDIMGLEVFDDYIARLQAFISETGANIKSHYQTLLKWYNEDRSVKK